MDRFTIIPDNHMVYVDGEALRVDCSTLPAGVNAVQFYTDENRGWIEWVHDGLGEHRPNSPLDLKAFEAMFKDHHDAWHAAKAKAVAETVLAKPPAKPDPAVSGMNVVAN